MNFSVLVPGRLAGWVGLALVSGVLVACKPSDFEKADDEGAVEVVPSNEGTGSEMLASLEGEEAVKPEVVVPAVVVPEVVKEKWSRDEAGFARYLPKDTEIYLEARKLEVLWDLFADLNADELMERLDLDDVADAAGEDAETVEEWKERVEEEVRTVFPALFGEEVFFAARGMDWWLKPYAHYQEVLYPKMLGSMVTKMVDGDFVLGGQEDQAQEMIGELMAFLQTEFDAVGQKPVMSLQFGGKVTESRGEIVEKIREWMTMAVEVDDPAFAKHEFTRNGVSWEGMILEWDEILEEASSGEGFEEFEELFGEERWDELREMAKELPLIFAVGEVGDYVVLSMGLGEQSVETVGNAELSLVGRDAFEGLTTYERGSILGMAWMDGELIEALQKLRSWGPVWQGMANGLDGSQRMGSAPLMAKSIREIARLSREKEAGKAHDLLGALVLKDGLHLKVRGGWQGEAMDLETPLKFAAAINQWEEQPFLRAHWRASASYGEKTLQQFEEAMNVVGLIGTELSELVEENFDAPENDADEDAEDDRETERERVLAESMKKDFLKAMENLWAGYRDHYRQALGEEAAFLVDLQGEAPPIVGFEEETLERGRIPRVAYVRSVKSRADLAATWELWRDSGVRFLGLLSEAVETPIPFPDTMSADSNDLRTHFIPMPFATDDFLPSLSVSDELFIVGSSKALASKIDKSMRQVQVDQPGGAGVLVEIEMSSWWDFCEAWVEVAEKGRLAANQEALDELDEPVEDAAEEDDDLDLEDLLDPENPDFEIEADGAVWEGFGELPFFDTEGLGAPEDLLRTLISKARQWRGVSYRRWLDDGVSHSSTSIHWGPTSEEAE